MFIYPSKEKTLSARHARGLKDPECISGIKSQWQTKPRDHFDVVTVFNFFSKSYTAQSSQSNPSKQTIKLCINQLAINSSY